MGQDNGIPYACRGAVVVFNSDPYLSFKLIFTSVTSNDSHSQYDDDRAVYCSFQKQTSYTFRGYVLRRDVTKFQGYTLLAV